VNKLDEEANEILRRCGKRSLRRAGIRLGLGFEREEKPTNDELAESAQTEREFEEQSRTPPGRWRSPK
jgi:hypothetical protein